VVDASEPLIEGVLLKNENGARAVTLMNWAYRTKGKRIANGKTSSLSGVVEFKELKIVLRGAGLVQGARSAILDKPLQVSTAGNETTIMLPELHEGDVLILE